MISLQKPIERARDSQSAELTLSDIAIESGFFRPGQSARHFRGLTGKDSARLKTSSLTMTIPYVVV
jgi:transcriptional regulator GlxA family with amidase domain